MKKLFNIKKSAVLISLSLLLFSSAYALPTIQYGFPAIPYDLDGCLSAASIALPESSYKITQRTKQHIMGRKGKFFIATIVCATYKSGVAFIVVNGRGPDSNPLHEEGLLQNNFVRSLRN